MKGETIHQLWPPLCRNCKDREICKELCPPAETYVSQDEIKEHDLLIGDGVEFLKDEDVLEVTEDLPLTPREEEIVTLFRLGATRLQVCEVLNITRDTLRINIHRIRIKALQDY